MTYSRKCTATNRQSANQSSGQSVERSVGFKQRNSLANADSAGGRENTLSFVLDFNSEHSSSYSTVTDMSLPTGSTSASAKAPRVHSTRHLHSPSCVYQG